MDTNKGTGITAVKAASSQPTIAELQARIAELEAAAQQQGELTIRINEFAKDEKGNILRDADGNPVPGKGTIAVYGMGKFPTSLYAEQWERLLAPNNVKRILELAKSPKASRKDRTSKVAANGAVNGANGQQTANGATAATTQAA